MVLLKLASIRGMEISYGQNSQIFTMAFFVGCILVFAWSLKPFSKYHNYEAVVKLHKNVCFSIVFLFNGRNSMVAGERVLCFYVFSSAFISLEIFITLNSLNTISTSVVKAIFVLELRESSDEHLKNIYIFYDQSHFFFYRRWNSNDEAINF